MALWRKSKKIEDTAVEKRDSDGVVAFPQKSRFATELCTRALKQLVSESYSETSWRKAILDVHTGKWIIVDHTVSQKAINEQEEERTTVLKAQATYEEALKSLLLFENGRASIGDIVPKDVPQNYYIFMAEYDGIILDESQEFHPTHNGQLVTNGRFDKETVARVLEKSKIPTESIRQALSLSGEETNPLFLGTASFISKHTLLDIGVDRSKLPDVTALDEYLKMGAVLVKVEEVIAGLKSAKDYMNVGLRAINKNKDIISISENPLYALKIEEEREDFSYYTYADNKEKKFFLKINSLSTKDKILSEDVFKTINQALFDVKVFIYTLELRLCFMAVKSKDTAIKKTAFERIETLTRKEDAGNRFQPKGIDLSAAITTACSDMKMVEPPALDKLIVEFETLQVKLQEKLERAQHLMAGPLSSRQTPVLEDQILPHQIAVVLDESELTHYKWAHAFLTQEQNAEPSWSVKVLSCRTQFNSASLDDDFKERVLPETYSDRAEADRVVQDYVPEGGTVLSLYPSGPVLETIKAGLIRRKDSARTLNEKYKTENAVGAFNFAGSETGDAAHDAIKRATEPRKALRVGVSVK